MSAQKTILVVEDEKDIAELYAQRLQAAGHNTVLAFDGLQGLEKLQEITPDLIILDLSMPKMSGLEFYRRICDGEEKPKYPVLIMTARAELGILFKDFQIDGFLAKPFDGKQFIEEVAIILRKQVWRREDNSPRRIIVVDDDEQALKDISAVFSKAGFKTDVANTAVLGIEKIMSNPPDLAVISLGLGMIAGDLVILRLRQMVKTQLVSFILYVKRNFEHDKTVMEMMATKTGVRLMYEYNDPNELLDAAVQVFQELDQWEKI